VTLPLPSLRRVLAASQVPGCLCWCCAWRRTSLSYLARFGSWLVHQERVQVV